MGKTGSGHGDGITNAQWPASTAHYLENVLGDETINPDSRQSSSDVGMNKSLNPFQRFASDEVLPPGEERALLVELMDEVNRLYYGNLVAFVRDQGGAEADIAKILSLLARNGVLGLLAGVTPSGVALSENSADAALLATTINDNSLTPGGIDLNPENLDLVIEQQSRLITSIFNPNNILIPDGQLKGFDATILRLMPIGSMPVAGSP